MPSAVQGGAPHRDARVSRASMRPAVPVACVIRVSVIATDRALLCIIGSKPRQAACVQPAVFSISKFDMISSARTSAE